MPLSIDQMRSAALEKLKANVQYQTEPQLSDPDLAQLLDDAKRADYWEANHIYSTGDVVLPLIPNGHRYRCIVPGTSGASEPNWFRCNESLSFSRARRFHPGGFEVFDGDGSGENAVIWQEDGPDFKNVFDVRLASHRGWMMKAAKATELIDYQVGRQRVDEKSVYDHCVQMAKMYAPLHVG